MNGIIIINKPKGCTSHDIVSKVKKITHEKIGHTGTLDPLATGVLPLLVGKGTLCSKYLINHDKEYIATIKLGIKTTTADKEGEIIQTKNVQDFKIEYIEKILKEFLGKQNQIPPIYSAIKVNGKKLYEYARKNQKVEIKPRKINIYEIDLLEYNNIENEVKFKVQCSKGTYIRSLCEDIAEKLGTIGFMTELQRTQVGEFNIKQAVSIDKINEDIIKQNIITIENLFKNKNGIEIDKRRLELFLNGVRLSTDLKSDIYRIYCEDKFVGIGEVKNKLLKRDIIVI